jgi:hypothetical protein
MIGRVGAARPVMGEVGLAGRHQTAEAVVHRGPRRRESMACHGVAVGSSGDAEEGAPESSVRARQRQLGDLAANLRRRPTAVRPAEAQVAAEAVGVARQLLQPRPGWRRRRRARPGSARWPGRRWRQRRRPWPSNGKSRRRPPSRAAASASSAAPPVRPWAARRRQGGLGRLGWLVMGSSERQGWGASARSSPTRFAGSPRTIAGLGRLSAPAVPAVVTDGHGRKRHARRRLSRLVVPAKGTAAASSLDRT